ncbi:hypothetical protein D3C78_1206000 [compost metagenome]
MASAHQRIVRTAAGTSTARASEIGLPMSRVSSSASSSSCASSSPAKRSSTALRLAGASRDHTPDSKVARASATAHSASASSQLATCASRRPSIGLRQSKVAPETAAAYSPWMKARLSIFRMLARCSHSVRLGVLMRCSGAVVWIIMAAAGKPAQAGAGEIPGRMSQYF